MAETPKAATPVKAEASVKTVVNNSKGLRYIGGVKILPGQSAKVSVSELNSAPVQAEIESGLLEVK